MISMVVRDIILKPKSKGVCLIRVDAIGDFILWLQTAKYYRQIYPNKKITLVCNEAYFSLAQNITIFDEVIGVNIKKFLSGKLRYFCQIIKRINKNNYAIVICDMYSRIFEASDFMVLATKAPQKIGFAGDLSNITSKQRVLSDGWYTRLIKIDDNIKFEINKNFEFIKNLSLEVQFKFVNILSLFKSVKEINLYASKSFIVINFGASVSSRMWPCNNFIKVINTIDLNYHILLVGSRSEQDLFEKYKTGIARPIINLIGETSFTETIMLISQAKLFIGNETSTSHIAAAVNTPSICILGGGHFSRFMPYDIKEPSWNFPQVVYTSMKCFNCNWHCIYPLVNNQTWRCIANVQVEQVISLVKKILCK